LKRSKALLNVFRAIRRNVLPFLSDYEVAHNADLLERDLNDMTSTKMK
jgi:hypothetical protein